MPKPLHNLRRPAALAAATCALALAVALGVIGCGRDDMALQPKSTPYEPSSFFADGNSSRPVVPGTVARDGRVTPRPPEKIGLFDIRASPPPATAFPFEITAADLDRGQAQFNALCAMCHGQTGDGNGMVVRRGFVPPPSYYEQRLRDAPIGHFYNVITDGYGAMYPYYDRVQPDDRWRIAAYIRALQLGAPDYVPPPATRPVIGPEDATKRTGAGGEGGAGE